MPSKLPCSRSISLCCAVSACVLLALGSCRRESHYLQKWGFICNMCMSTHRMWHCYRTARGKKRKNEPLKQQLSRHMHLLNWEPDLCSSTWKNSWWGDDLLWICEVKAPTENKIWLLLPGLRLISLIHWHDLTGSGVKSLPWLMQCATAAYLQRSLLSSEITCSSTHHQAITPSGMAHLGSHWCQWSGIGNSASLDRNLAWSFLPQNIRLHWRLTVSRARIKCFSNKILHQNI